MTGTLKDLIKIRRHFINLIIITFVWVASAFNYYLINFLLKSIPGNIFLITSFCSAGEIIAYVFGGIFYQRLGIRPTLCGCFAISCIGAISILTFGSSNQKLIPGLILFTRFGVSATFNISYLANAQLFPPIFAGTAIGICSMFAKLSTIIAPMLAEVPAPAPMIVFAIFTGAVSLISLLVQLPPKKFIVNYKF